jgi:lysozyme
MAVSPRQGIRRAGVVAMLVTTLAFAWALTAAGAAEGSIRGIDVSRFNGEIDWQQVGETKIRFAYLQASRGSGRDCMVAPAECGRDRTYRSNLRGARANGIRVGAYHRAFAAGRSRAKAKSDARAEAKVFIRRVGKLRSRDLLPALDVETPFKNLSQVRLRLWIKVWTQRVERRLGAKPIIYTNHSSWQATGDTRRFARRGHQLWVANYNVRSPLVPARNWNGRGWKIWQFTSTGRVRGINGNVDKNRLEGGLGKITVGPRPPDTAPDTPPDVP